MLRGFLKDRQKALLAARQALIDLENETCRLTNSKSALLENPVALNRLAATDLFVEKAQHVLTQRAKVMRRAGQACFLVSSIVLGVAVYLAHRSLGHTDNPANNELILSIVRSLIFGGYVVIILRLTIALGRSFFHEATVLLNRRHAMRLGRLVAHRLPFEHLDVDDLEKAFDWNMVSDSSFKDIDANRVTETVIGNLLNLKAIAESLKKIDP